MNAIEILKNNEELIKQKYGVKRIGIFGSFARNEEKEESDVDILVEFESDFETFDNYIELKYFLEDLFRRKVDSCDLRSPQATTKGRNSERSHVCVEIIFFILKTFLNLQIKSLTMPEIIL